MPKIVINRGRSPDERKLISDRTDEINADLREITGNIFARATDVAQYLTCSRRSVNRYIGAHPEYRLPPLRRACGTNKYRTIDIARRLAELEALRG